MKYKKLKEENKRLKAIIYKQNLELLQLHTERSSDFHVEEYTW